MARKPSPTKAALGKASYLKTFDQTALVELVLRQSRIIAEILEANGQIAHSDGVREATMAVYNSTVNAGYTPDPNRFARPEFQRNQDRQVRYFASNGIFDPADMNDCIAQIQAIGDNMDDKAMERILNVKKGEIMERSRPRPPEVVDPEHSGTNFDLHDELEEQRQADIAAAHAAGEGFEEDPPNRRLEVNEEIKLH